MARNREYCKQCHCYVTYGGTDKVASKRRHLEFHDMIRQFYSTHPDVLELERFVCEYYPV